jgi:hypothetical protein
VERRGHGAVGDIVAGISEELGALLDVHVDVVTDALLRQPVSATAHADAVPL